MLSGRDNGHKTHRFPRRIQYRRPHSHRAVRRSMLLRAPPAHRQAPPWRAHSRSGRSASAPEHTAPEPPAAPGREAQVHLAGRDGGWYRSGPVRCEPRPDACFTTVLGESRDRRPAQHPVHPGRSAQAPGAVRIRRSRGDTPSRPAVRRRGGIRERLLQLSALCAVALLDAGRDAAFAGACIRQRRRVRRRHTHHGALSAACRLSHHVVGEAALRRAGHAARVSRAARSGAVPHRFRLGTELGRGPHGFEQRRENHHPVRHLRAQRADGSRRDGPLPGGLQAA